MVCPHEPTGDKELVQWRQSLDAVDLIARDIWVDTSLSKAAPAPCPGSAARYKKRKRPTPTGTRGNAKEKTRGSTGTTFNAERKTRTAQEITDTLRQWVEQLQNLYPTTAEKRCFAKLVGITLVQVHTFCSNQRKRFTMVGGKLVSYKRCGGSPGRS